MRSRNLGPAFFTIPVKICRIAQRYLRLGQTSERALWPRLLIAAIPWIILRDHLSAYLEFTCNYGVGGFSGGQPMQKSLISVLM